MFRKLSALSLMVLLAFVSLSAVSRPVYRKEAMVTSAHIDATNAGVEILKMGGNAIDAAVATALAISVVEPFSAGLGGGGFLLVHLAKDKKILALDFREVAPMLATETMYSEGNSKKSSVDGHFAVAVPGTVAGLYEVHSKYGKLPWRKLFEPAIELAKHGFSIDSKFTDLFEMAAKRLESNRTAWGIFTREGKPFMVGDTLKQLQLGKTLEILSRNPRSFYEGEIAQAIVGEMKSNDGLISLDDLRSYRPRWRDPVCGQFKGSEICSMPPPSSGGILLIQMLNAVTEIGTEKLPWHEPATLNMLSQIMKASFKDRADLLGDPDFVKIPVDKLISRDYAKKQIREISPAIFKESPETTHLNVVDSERNAVSMTFTVNLAFGSGVAAGNTGILLNNEMDDFSSAPGVPNAFGLVGGSANAIAPKKIPLSSMTPVIARKNQEFQFAVGSPGGSRIISTVFHSILNYMVYEMNPEEAISAGRFHHQWLPNEISFEKHALEPATVRELTKMGNKMTLLEPWSNANMIVAAPSGGLEGACDPRGHGTADGY